MKRLEALAAALGTKSQQARFAEGVLPEEELLALARGEIFRSFTGFARWAGRDRIAVANEIRHRRGCAGGGAEFETRQAAELNAKEWETLTRLRDLATGLTSHPWGVSAEVVTVTHWATCTTCKAARCRSVAKVSAVWAGRTLVREYVL